MSTDSVLKIADRIGVCSWSLQCDDTLALILRLKELGLNKVQLALSPLVSEPSKWEDAGERLRDAGVLPVSGMFGTEGEDYTTLKTIRETGGFIRDDTWERNFNHAKAVGQIGSGMGLTRISTHAGFLTADPEDPTFSKLIDRLRAVADYYADLGITLLFETGQETADTLLQFLDALDRENVAVNFDPANMILYGMGDPVASLAKLLPRLGQVHIKDGVAPDTPGEWGREVAAGEGDVDWPGVLGTLAHANYAGDLMIEREAGSSRLQDIATAHAVVVQTWPGRAPL